jgi:tetratricopeptide (TPR) repeat protein
MDASSQRSWVPRILSGKGTRVFRRPIYVVWLSLLTIAFFAFTFGINRLYAQKQQQLSRYWFRHAQNALTANRPADAISDLRTALLYSRDNSQYLFTLAQALEADGRIPEARSYFLNLLEDEPGNGAFNLELARLAARENDVNHAMRYYNGAIYGAWDSDPVLKRQRARQELIAYLLSKNMGTQARGELLTLTTEMPKNAESELWVANSFGRLGDDRSALDFYKAAIRLDHKNDAALLGAGEAAFRLTRYPEALDYFKRAATIHDDPTTSQWLQLTSFVLDLNAFESRISAAERRHRLILAMDIADRRLRQCAQTRNIVLDTPGNDPMQLARAQWIQLDSQIQRARADADVVQLLAPVATLIVSVEQLSGCGPLTLTDQAALRVYQNAEELQP